MKRRWASKQSGELTKLITTVRLLVGWGYYSHSVVTVYQVNFVDDYPRYIKDG